MKKTKLTRSLLAACSIVALSVVLSGCLHSSDDTAETEPPVEPTEPVDPGPTDEEIAAATKAAGTKRAAIEAEASQGPNQTPINDDAGLGGSAADGTAVDTYSLAISRDRSGTKITIDDTAMAGDDDPKFAQTMDLGDGLTRHERDNGEGVVEVVMVSTDIEAPTGVAFAMWDNNLDATDTLPQALNARDLDDAVDADGDGTATNDFTALTVAQDAATYMLVASASFVPGAGATTQLTFDDDDTTTAGMDEAAEVAGTYNGAMGTYRCNGTADCTVTVNAMGAVTAMSAGWVFTPDAGATSDQPDYDYLHYGFWLKKTTKDGETTYNEVETFAGSSTTASGSVAAVVGTATYSGGAAGVYVHSVINPDGSEASATSGHFTADAELTANFGGPDVAVNDQFMISGTIDNFALSGHDEGPGWSVSLEDGGDTDNIADGTGTFSGVAKGGGADGSYSGTFHGTADADNQPHTAVGEFNANFANGTVAGGFGARIDEE